MQVHVTAVCGTANLDFVRSLGAAEIVDYMRTDLFQHSERFDAVFDCIGQYTFSSFRRLLRPGGIHVGIAGRRELVIDSILSRLTPGRRSYQFHVRAIASDLEHIRSLIDLNQVRPVVSHTFPLSEIAAAHRQCESRRTRGKIAVELGAI
jgi:NADPH:quinone reductase-like Zn-dependent oxidoreductase